MNTDVQLAAARIALLALRSGISRSVTLHNNRFGVNSSLDRLTANRAAELLASFSKPLQCQPQARDGILEITTSPLLPHTPEFFLHSATAPAWHRTLAGLLSPRLWFALRARRTVYCLGRDEAFTVPVSAVEVWERDYYVKGVNFTEDFVYNPLARTRPEYKAAQQSKAAWLIVFSSPADSTGRFAAEIRLE